MTSFCPDDWTWNTDLWITLWNPSVGCISWSTSSDSIGVVLDINSSSEEDFEEEGTAVVVSKTKPKLKKPPLYRVIIFNDDYTPMEFVVYVLQSFFGIDRDKATQIMLQVHTHGKGVCGIFTKEIAETRSTQVNNFARENEHPLISEIEPVDED